MRRESGRSLAALLMLGLAMATAGTQAAPDFVTVVGGSGDDRVFDIAVDAAGYSYVTGETSSADLPVVGGVQSQRRGTHDAFVLKLAPDGAVVFLSYLGGDGFDSGRGIAVDAAGRIWVTGYTESANFPLQDPLDANRGGFSDAFIARLSAAGDLLQFSTYFGGNSADNGEAIAVDTEGHIYVAGRTSGGLSVVNAAQATFGGVEDAFVLRLDSALSAYQYVSYLGGNFSDIPAAIAVDPSGQACIAGFSQSTTFPTINPAQPGNAGAADAFYTVVATDGTQFVLSSLLGGSARDEARAVSCDATRLALVGDSDSVDFPTGSTGGPPVQSVAGGGRDGFLVEVSISSGAVQRSTYAGGFRDDRLVGVGQAEGGVFQAHGDTRSSTLAMAAGAPTAAATSGVHTSADGGATWQAAGLQGLAINELLVIPGSPGYRIAATDDGMYVSTDAGVTWIAQTDDYLQRVVHDVTYDPANPCVWIAGINSAPVDGANPVGAVRSSDCGATWVPWSFPALRFRSVAFLVDTTRVVASIDRVSTAGGGSLSDVCLLDASGALRRCLGQGGSQFVVQVDRTISCGFLVGDMLGNVTIFQGTVANGCDHPLGQAFTTATAGSPVTALLAMPSATAGQTLLVAGARDGRIALRDGAGSWSTATTLQCPVSALAYLAAGGSVGIAGRRIGGGASILAAGCPTLRGEGLVELAPDAPPLVTPVADDTGAARFGTIARTNLQAFLASTAITSRIAAYGSLTEELLFLDDPGTCDREVAASAIKATNIRIGANLRNECGYGNNATYLGTRAGQNIGVVAIRLATGVLYADGFEGQPP